MSAMLRMFRRFNRKKTNERAKRRLARMKRRIDRVKKRVRKGIKISPVDKALAVRGKRARTIIGPPKALTKASAKARKKIASAIKEQWSPKKDGAK